MTEKDTREMQAALAKPFAPEDLEWRLQNTIEESMRGMAVPYVTNRAIQNRLDEVCGPENWYNEFKPWHSNGKKDAQLCGIAIYFEGKGFITKWDGAEDSDIEPIKGGLSDSMKRAAYQWGIGRVLYSLDTVWVDIERRGRSYITFSQLKMNRVEISLYDVVKSTGEVKDTFKFTYSGRRYDRLSLSEKIRAGMELSELIKRLTGRNYPVFVDNMESVDDLANVRPTGQIIMAKCVSNAPLQVRPIKPIVFAEQRAA